MIAFDRLMIVYDRKWNAKKEKDKCKQLAIREQLVRLNSVSTSQLLMQLTCNNEKKSATNWQCLHKSLTVNKTN